MGRPVGADAQLTRRRVLNCAAMLFAAQGNGQTSMRQIAGEAGVSLGTVHHYFGSKDALYDSCIEAMYQELGELREHLLGDFSPDGNLEEMLETVVRETFRFTRKKVLAVRLLMREVVDSGAVDCAKRDRFVAPFLVDAARMLEVFFGFEPLKARLLFQSIVNTLVRYAMSSEQELASMSGFSEKKALQAVEDHLVELVHSLILVGQR
ncbi:MAG: TetR/AcrR family transcriptional regulator [Myxococcota bacterium]|nr:TetR/AcrR family transcriptional regulator [Myxococcota bacterium]